MKLLEMKRARKRHRLNNWSVGLLMQRCRKTPKTVGARTVTTQQPVDVGDRRCPEASEASGEPYTTYGSFQQDGLKCSKSTCTCCWMQRRINSKGESLLILIVVCFVDLTRRYQVQQAMFSYGNEVACWNKEYRDVKRHQ